MRRTSKRKGKRARPVPPLPPAAEAPAEPALPAKPARQFVMVGPIDGTPDPVIECGNLIVEIGQMLHGFSTAVGVVESKTAALLQAIQAAQREMHEAHLETIHRLAVAAEHRDDDTGAHIQRVGRYCSVMARALNMPPTEVELIEHASTTHDIGKLAIPDAILFKADQLTATEWEVMKEHTVIGARILGGSHSPVLQVGEIIALTHHEKWDGNGYPQGLAGQAIPVWGRICAVADAFDALTNERPYRRAYSNEEALNTIRQASGTAFDPQVVGAFLANLDEITLIQGFTVGLLGT